MAKRRGLWKGDTPIQKLVLAAVLVGYGIYLIRKQGARLVDAADPASGTRVSIDTDLAGDMISAAFFQGNPIVGALVKHGAKRVLERRRR
jgi:hypothetical protein